MARRRQFPVSQRRRTGWDNGSGGIATLNTVTSTSVALVGSGFIIFADGNTIVRTRGMIQCILTAADAPLSGFRGAFGICIVSEDAFAVGVTAVPDPVDDAEWDGWFWHQFYSLMQPITFAAQSTASAILTIPIDSKAMRKIGATDVVVLVGEHIESGTASMTVVADSRLLFKLP